MFINNLFIFCNYLGRCCWIATRLLLPARPINPFITPSPQRPTRLLKNHICAYRVSTPTGVGAATAGKNNPPPNPFPIFNSQFPHFEFRISPTRPLRAPFAAQRSLPRLSVVGSTPLIQNQTFKIKNKPTFPSRVCAPYSCRGLIP